MAQTKVKLISDGVIVQSNLHVSHGITTADIGEGSNLYYTDARVGSYLSTNSFATESYVGTQIANLVDSSPSALNTLNELAAALGDDANFSTTVTNSIALKAPLASPSFTGNATFASNVTVGNDLTVGDDINISGEQLTFTDDAASAYIRAADALLIQSDYNTGENKPIYLQPSAVTELTIATGTSTFAGAVDVTSGASLGSGLQVNRTGHPSLSIITGGNTNAYIGIAPSGGTYVDAITISDTGNSTFAGDVNINSSGDLYINSGTSYNNKGSIFMSNQRTEIVSDIVNATANGDTSLNFKTRSAGATASAMFIDEFRRVGIGTDSPSATLDVDDDNTGKIRLLRNGSTRVELSNNANEGELSLYRSSTAKTIYISSYYDSYFNGGNVGIGTTSPSATLDVHAPSTTAPSLTMGAAAGQIFKNEDLEFAFGLNNASPYNGYIQTRFASAPFYRNLAINPLGGNVGIGTNSPDYKLEVQGVISSADSGLQKSTFANAGNDLVLTANADATNVTANILFKSSGSGGAAVSEKMRITSGGDVLIATNGKFLQGKRNTGSVVIDIIGFGAGTDTLQIKGGTSGAANAISFYDTGGFLGTFYNSNFGIGTTTPFSKLQVGNNTFGGNNGMYSEERVGMSNHGSLTGLMLASTYNDAAHPEYGLVFVQGPSTSSYNVWSISPDGPAKGTGLNFHYQAQSTNVHSPGNRIAGFTQYGLTFNQDTAAANALDDYEEGTWTPDVHGSTTRGTPSYQYRSGSYTKIGNRVWCRFGFKLSSISGATGRVRVDGLPFTSRSYGAYQEPNFSVSTGLLATTANAYKARLFVVNNSSYLEGRISVNTDTIWNISDFGGDEWIILAFHYETHI